MLSFTHHSLFRMLRLKVVLLAFLVSSILTTGEAGRQRRATSKSKSKERKNVAKLFKKKKSKPNITRFHRNLLDYL